MVRHQNMNIAVWWRPTSHSNLSTVSKNSYRSQKLHCLHSDNIGTKRICSQILLSLSFPAETAFRKAQKLLSLIKISHKENFEPWPTQRGMYRLTAKEKGGIPTRTGALRRCSCCREKSRWEQSRSRSQEGQGQASQPTKTSKHSSQISTWSTATEGIHSIWIHFQQHCHRFNGSAHKIKLK